MTLDTRHWKLETGRKQETGESSSISSLQPPASRFQGYTLIELIVSVGLFALVMMLASGAYLVMIGVNRHVQGVATGIDNLSFALEAMTRTIRTGSDYGCPSSGMDCTLGGSTFSVIDSSGVNVIYTLSGGTIIQTRQGNPVSLTEPSVNVSSLTFYTFGTVPGDTNQPRVTMVITGTVSSGKGKEEKFNIETGATMRGSDL